MTPFLTRGKQKRFTGFFELPSFFYQKQPLYIQVKSLIQNFKQTLQVLEKS